MGNESNSILTYSVTLKAKCKFLPVTGHEGPEGDSMYIRTLFLKSVRDGVGNQRRAPVTLPLG